MKNDISQLIKEISGCTVCEQHLPFSPKPIFSFSKNSKIVLIGQAPGKKVHESEIPWDDASGERLREWLRVTAKEFYNTDKFAIVPMGFCYPGKGKSGDLPPRPECAPLWMDKIMTRLNDHNLTILIGAYAQKYFLGTLMKQNLTKTVQNWREYTPEFAVLPHPSPRNNIWLKKNPWFSKDVLPGITELVRRNLS